MLEEFISSKENRKWLNYEHMDVYVRKGHHRGPHIESEESTIFPTLDIASVSIEKKRYRSKGLFTKFITNAEELADKHRLNVYVESILEPRLIGFLERRGYELVEPSMAPCMIRVKFN